MLSPPAMRRMASPKRPATEITSTLSGSGSGWVSTVSVMNSVLIGLARSRSAAGGASSPWVTPALGEHPGRVDERPRRDREVVHDQGRPAFDGPDELGHLGRLGVVDATLVRDGERSAQPLRPLAGLLGEAGVGRDDDQVTQVLRPDRFGQHRERVEVVDRPVEETLHLGRMEVHRHHPVRARRFDRVGAHPGPDRDPRLVLLVALGVAEVGDHGGDRCGAGPLEGVDPEQQLHEIVVGRERCPLDDVGVPAPNVLEDLDEQVALREPQHLGATDRDIEVFGDRETEPP
jgi:hypothetical protein